MIYTFLVKSAQKNPNHPALITSLKSSYSYEQLVHYVHQWAHYLLKLGVKQGDRIGLMSDEDDLHVFIYLALDCIGACYVPLDPETPIVQLEQGLARLNLQILLTSSAHYPEQITRFLTPKILSVETMECQNLPQEKPEEAYPNGDQSLIYIMSSSGSTGDKKYIPILGAGLSYWAAVENQLLKLASADIILSTRSPTFDARISEYLRAFAQGAKLVLMSHQERKDIQKVIQACHDHQISTLLMVPSQLESSSFNASLMGLAHSGLKHLMVTGEACNWTLAKLCKQARIKLWNAYGPTEATFGMSLLEITDLVTEDLEEIQPVPIGKPIAPVTYSIKNDMLVIHSPFLTPGYLGQDPLENKEDAEELSFNTGDLFSETKEHLLFKGRSSFHCKVGGVKVSPTRIEAVIQSYTKESVQGVVVIKLWLGHLKPVAYIKHEADFDKEAFLTHLQDQLSPAEMPLCLSIAIFPRLPASEKIDRLNLIEVPIRTHSLLFHLKDEIQIPENHQSLLKSVLSLWQGLFGIESISPNQSFLTLGGDSISANALVEQVKKNLDSEYRSSDFLLSGMTPLGMAKQLSQKRFNLATAVATPLILQDPFKPIVFMVAPLLGEGCFTYQHLAARYAATFGVSVYGLSNKLVFEEGPLPESLEEEAEQFYAAIKKVQPQGPYRLFGFSYGATLAYQIAAHCLTQGDKIASLELMDGFPPQVMQRIPGKAHNRLLYSLLNFVVSLLKNKHYAEHIEFPISEDQAVFERQLAILCTQEQKEEDKNSHPHLVDLAEKYRQVQTLFSIVRAQIKGNAALRILNLAERHLLIILTQPKPHHPLRIIPTVFQSDESQDYWKMMDTIQGLTPRAPNRRYLFWNDGYFSSVRRNGVKIPAQHLELLLGGPNELGQTPETYWFRSNHDRLFNSNDRFSPPSFYTVAPSEGLLIYNVHFLRLATGAALIDYLQKKGIAFKQLRCQSSLELIEQKDALATALRGIQFSIGFWQQKEVEEQLTVWKLRPRDVPHSQTGAKAIQLQGSLEAIYLTILWNGTPVLDFAFDELEIRQLKQKTLSVPKEFSMLPCPNSNCYCFVFPYFNYAPSSISKAIDQCAVFLGEFIARLNAALSDGQDIADAPFKLMA